LCVKLKKSAPEKQKNQLLKNSTALFEAPSILRSGIHLCKIADFLIGPFRFLCAKENSEETPVNFMTSSCKYETNAILL